ncbi:WD40 repeat-like protein [Mycena venus]|uniref:WD40 repeat-like protein n=1 Tax=Mycena venus TaxID=2733690 RepID=A0A8H6XED3_9AGAR|nr:WD40 repeat-like protein [Mycena venus]
MPYTNTPKALMRLDPPEAIIQPAQESQLQRRWGLGILSKLTPSPGQTLNHVYTFLGEVLQARANRAAHNLGLGPYPVTQKIKHYFGADEERRRKLELLQISMDPKLKKRCGKLFEIRTAYRIIQYTMRDIQICMRGATSAESVSALWVHFNEPQDKEWTFWQTLAASCLSETTISVLLEESSVAYWSSCRDGQFSVIEQLLVECDCSETSMTLCIRYLGGILDLPGFWSKMESVHSQVAKKLCCRMIQMLKDIGVDILLLGPLDESEPPFDHDGVDFLAMTILRGLSSWCGKLQRSDWASQPCPRSAELLPNSADHAVNSLEDILPTACRDAEVDILMARMEDEADIEENEEISHSHSANFNHNTGADMAGSDTTELQDAAGPVVEDETSSITGNSIHPSPSTKTLQSVAHTEEADLNHNTGGESTSSNTTEESHSHFANFNHNTGADMAGSDTTELQDAAGPVVEDETSSITGNSIHPSPSTKTLQSVAHTEEADLNHNTGGESASSNTTEELDSVRSQGHFGGDERSSINANTIGLARIGRDQAIKIAVADAAEDSAKLGSRTSSDIPRVADFAVQNSDSDIVSSQEDLLQSLTSSLDVVIKIGGVIPKIHPFAELAYNVLTSLYVAVKKQRKTDQAITQLVQMMVDAYSFTKDIESLPEITRIQNIVCAIVQETAKCALFIREYTGHVFAVRMISQILSEDAQTIQDYMVAFEQHKQSLDWALGVHIAFVANNTLEVAKDTRDTAQRLGHSEQLEMLKSLNPVKMNSNRGGCLFGTRRDILSLITDELTKRVSAHAQNIFWLYGVAGAGKSTIAMSIHQTFDALGLLGISLFFTRGNEANSPSTVIRTIAYSLAESNTHIGSEICSAMRQHPHIVDASLDDQFQKLLVEPLSHAKDNIRGPKIIILDALDECGNPESRRHLVSVISNRFATLPMLRVFITSRPDSDIAAAFRIQSSIIKTPLDITKPPSLEDIRLYFDNEMVYIRQIHFSRNLGPTWPGDEKIAALCTCAGGLFSWASAATEYLRTAYNPTDALDHLLKKGVESG